MSIQFRTSDNFVQYSEDGHTWSDVKLFMEAYNTYIENIDHKQKALCPGRDLDVRIAVEFFGMKHIDIEEAFFEGPDTLFAQAIVHNFSTEIACAWPLINMLKEKHDHFKLEYVNGFWYVQLGIDGPIVEAVTAPHAICLAALGIKSQF
jgi:Phage ABA sandwich domain